MSSCMGTSGQCFARTLRQYGSISQKATVCIPARSRPNENPPIPENKSNTRMSVPECAGFSTVLTGVPVADIQILSPGLPSIPAAYLSIPGTVDDPVNALHAALSFRSASIARCKSKARTTCDRVTFCPSKMRRVSLACSLRSFSVMCAFISMCPLFLMGGNPSLSRCDCICWVLVPRKRPRLSTVSVNSQTPLISRGASKVAVRRKHYRPAVLFYFSTEQLQF